MKRARFSTWLERGVIVFLILPMLCRFGSGGPFAPSNTVAAGSTLGLVHALFVSPLRWLLLAAVCGALAVHGPRMLGSALRYAAVGDPGGTLARARLERIASALTSLANLLLALGLAWSGLEAAQRLAAIDSTLRGVAGPPPVMRAPQVSLLVPLACLVLGALWLAPSARAAQRAAGGGEASGAVGPVGGAFTLLYVAPMLLLLLFLFGEFNA